MSSQRVRGGSRHPSMPARAGHLTGIYHSPLSSHAFARAAVRLYFLHDGNAAALSGTSSTVADPEAAARLATALAHSRSADRLAHLTGCTKPVARRYLLKTSWNEEAGTGVVIAHAAVVAVDRSPPCPPDDAAMKLFFDTGGADDPDATLQREPSVDRAFIAERSQYSFPAVRGHGCWIVWAWVRRSQGPPCTGQGRSACTTIATQAVLTLLQFRAHDSAENLTPLVESILQDGVAKYTQLHRAAGGMEFDSFIDVCVSGCSCHILGRSHSDFVCRRPASKSTASTRHNSSWKGTRQFLSPNACCRAVRRAGCRSKII